MAVSLAASWASLDFCFDNRVIYDADIQYLACCRFVWMNCDFQQPGKSLVSHIIWRLKALLSLWGLWTVPMTWCARISAIICMMARTLSTKTIRGIVVGNTLMMQTPDLFFRTQELCLSLQVCLNYAAPFPFSSIFFECITEYGIPSRYESYAGKNDLQNIWKRSSIPAGACARARACVWCVYVCCLRPRPCNLFTRLRLLNSTSASRPQEPKPRSLYSARSRNWNFNSS